MLPRDNRSVTVAINAQLPPGVGAGGVQSVLIGLVHALGQLQDGPEEYTVIVHGQNREWLDSYMGPNQRTVSVAENTPGRSLKSTGPLLGLLRKAVSKLLPVSGGARPEVPISDGFYESLGCDVIHFPYWQFAVCALPTIYNPHDLQHLHYPQFFTPSEIAWRETMYPAACRSAHTVAVASQWVKQQVVDTYQVEADKVQVIPWAPPTQAYAEPKPESLAAAREKYQLEVPFVLYPAMTWEHKNHIRLLEALAMLRDRDGLKVSLVCTGRRNEFWQRIQERLLALGLQDQVRFLGLVPPEDLRALYRLAQFVVIPSLFEAASAPLWEAWQDNAPAACSTVTSLPEQAGDAALLFDPLSVGAIAEAVARMATDAGLREELRRRGAQRLQDFSWERTARAYRAVYRRAARRPLSEEDRWLLGWDWMAEPHKKRVGG